MRSVAFMNVESDAGTIPACHVGCRYTKLTPPPAPKPHSPGGPGTYVAPPASGVVLLGDSSVRILELAEAVLPADLEERLPVRAERQRRAADRGDLGERRREVDRRGAAVGGGLVAVVAGRVVEADALQARLDRHALPRPRSRSSAASRPSYEFEMTVARRPVTIMFTRRDQVGVVRADRADVDDVRARRHRVHGGRRRAWTRRTTPCRSSRACPAPAGG